MTSQISDLGGSRSIIISPDDTSLSLAQAIYHHVTTKTEQIVETFRDSYVVCEADIYQLSHVLKQVAQRHHEDEWSCVIDHALFKRSRTRFSSFDRFKMADKSQSDPTSEIVVTYDFLSVNPFVPQTAKVNPERYKIEVRVSQESYLAMLDQDDARPSFISRLFNFPSITVSVQYVDYTVARAILSGVREWVAALDAHKQSKFSRFFMKHEFSLQEVIPSILAACIFLGASGISNHVASVNYNFVFSTLALAVLFYGLGSLIAESLVSNINALQIPTMILITRGDTVHQSEVKKRRARAKSLVGLLFSAFFLAVVVNVFSSFVYQWITM